MFENGFTAFLGTITESDEGYNDMLGAVMRESYVETHPDDDTADVNLVKRKKPADIGVRNDDDIEIIEEEDTLEVKEQKIVGNAFDNFT